MKKFYSGIIEFRIEYETTKFFGYKKESYLIDGRVNFPYYIYATDKKTAERFIKMSDFWKNETLSIVSEELYGLHGMDYSLEGRELYLEEVKYYTLNMLKDNVLAEQYFEYLSDVKHQQDEIESSL